jgi:hypothetical protein
MSLAAEIQWTLLPLTALTPQVAFAGILEPAYDAAERCRGADARQRFAPRKARPAGEPSICSSSPTMSPRPGSGMSTCWPPGLPHRTPYSLAADSAHEDGFA